MTNLSIHVVSLNVPTQQSEGVIVAHGGGLLLAEFELQITAVKTGQQRA